MYYNNGDIYEGDWEDNKRNGEGKTKTLNQQEPLTTTQKKHIMDNGKTIKDMDKEIKTMLMVVDTKEIG